MLKNDVIPLSIQRAKTHIRDWAGKVEAEYDLLDEVLLIHINPVRETWRIRALPKTAMKLARDFKAPIKVR